MADDATTLLKLLEVSVHDKKIVKMPLDVIVSQQSYDEKLAKKVVCIRVERLTWDN
jgi:hypothetical protein